MQYIENIVIGEPIVPIKKLLCDNINSKYDWDNIEKDKTYYTEERYLPKILVDIGFVKSISEVKRNKPQLNIKLNKLDFMEVKWGKNKCWIIVGE
jgi:hypothetical protein